MMQHHNARHGYKTVQREMNSDKGIELKVFVSVTAALNQVDPKAADTHSQLADALVTNAKLWNILFIDLSSQKNTLPLDLKTRLMTLAEFTQEHTQKVLRGDADHSVLVDINKSIIAGLRAQSKLSSAAEPAQTEAA